MTWLDDMAAASVKAFETKGEPVEARELECITEWALMFNEKSRCSGDLVAGPYVCADEEAARLNFGFRDKTESIDLVSRRVMRTKWEVQS